MGLFNSGKNDKVEKVNKYERHYNVPPNSSRRRSSKHRSHHGEPAAVRAMSQPPLMRMGGAGAGPGAAGGFYRPGGNFPQVIVGPFVPNVMPQVRFPMGAYDLSKYAAQPGFPANPFAASLPPINLPPGWNKGMPLVNNRSVFPGPLNDYQAGGWPVVSPSNYGYMPAMKF